MFSDLGLWLSVWLCLWNGMEREKEHRGLERGAAEGLGIEMDASLHTSEPGLDTRFHSSF